MSIEFIDLKSQYSEIRENVNERIQRVLDHGKYIMGPEVFELEKRLEVYTGAKHCITVASGTEALLIALMALGVGHGDEVVTVAFTFAATAEVIALVGATPVFVDVQSDTGNIDPAALEVAITARTRAIIAVSLYGQPADMAEITAIADRHGLPVIDDAAQSFGSTYRDKRTGTLATITCTSFFPSKPLGCYGDGGAIFTDDDALATAMREIRVHGQERRYFHTRIGVGGRMDTIQCAVVLAKLDVFDAELVQREEVAQRYFHLLKDFANALTLPVVRPDRKSAWAQFTIQVSDRDRFVERLAGAGIPTSIHYPLPLHQQPAYKDLCIKVGRLDRSESLAARAVSLPMHPYLTVPLQKRITEIVRQEIAG